MLRALIVDDEPVARQILRDYSQTVGDLEIVGECCSGQEAILAIRRERPDLVFLDIAMRPVNGFEVVAALSADEMPLVIFVSAYDEHAIRAFDVNALDYLLKPINAERFNEALRRARQRVTLATPEDMRRELQSAVQGALRYLRRPGDGEPERLIVEVGGKVHILEAVDVEVIESERNNVRLHAQGQQFTVRASLGELESRLPPKRFLRIHRSVLINLGQVQAMGKSPDGEYVVTLKSGRSFTSGRAYRARIQGMLLRSRRSDAG
jgi:two-component system LytT family response regulator